MTSPFDLTQQSANTAPLLLRHPWVRRILQSTMAVAAVGTVALYAFALTFTTFATFDDEGYFLQAYRDFLSGKTPYDQVFAFYGPFTFYGGALIARFNVANVTHDDFRWALLPLWIAIAALMAAIVWQWSGRFSPALIAFFLIGFRLLGLTVSSGHPQVWVILAVALLLWFGIDWAYEASQQWRAFGTGFLIGAVLLCKVNIGVFVCVGVGLAASLVIAGRLRIFASDGFLMLAIGLGLMVFFAGSTISEKYFALFYILSLTGTVAVAMRRPSKQTLCWRNVLWSMAGFATCVFAGIGFVLFYGTTLKSLFNSLIVYPALLARSYHQPFWSATERTSMFVSIGGVSAAIAVLYGKHLGKAARDWLGPLKVVAGVGLLLAFVRWPEEALTGSFLFLWLLLIDERPLSQSAYAKRVLLIAMCLLFSLQLFPVAGTQVTWAELLPILAAALLVADGVNCIERDVSETSLPRPVVIGVLWMAPLFAVLLFVPCGKAALVRYRQWHSASSLGLPGAHWLRLPRPEAARLTIPVAELQHHCKMVLTIPGMYSYSIWSGVPPMETKRINSWPFMWPEEVLKEDLPKLQEQEGACALVNQGDYEFFKRIAVAKGDDRVLFEIRSTMIPLFTYQDIALYGNSSAQSVARK